MAVESCFRCGATENLGRLPINSGLLTCKNCDLVSDVERKLGPTRQTRTFNAETGQIEVIDVPATP